jgi:hypothetical protein
VFQNHISFISSTSLLSQNVSHESSSYLSCDIHL